MILNICTYNVRTLSDDVYLASLEAEIENINWDVIGISEMRRQGESITELRFEHLIYVSGGDQQHKKHGVGTPLQ